MAKIYHWSERNSRLISQGMLDGSTTWVQDLPGFSPQEAEQAQKDLLGRPQRIERSGDQARLVYSGFTITITS